MLGVQKFPLLDFYPQEPNWKELWSQNGCGFTTGKSIFLWLFIFISGFSLTQIAAMLIYVYIEKPSVDARRVFA